MKDFLGRDFGVGDVVAFVEPTYHGMCLGVVIRETPKGATMIRTGKHHGWNGYMGESCNRPRSQIIKANIE